MILVVTGAGGQVGKALVREAERMGVTSVAFLRAELDISDPKRVQTVLGPVFSVPAAETLDAVERADSIEHRVLINLAAYTDVDAAEQDPESAFRVNADGVEILAGACSAYRVPMLHVSTDQVFDGTASRPYLESSSTSPVNEYGRSKWAGEQALRSTHHQHLIVRTSWVFGSDGSSFVTKMLDLASRNEEVRVVSDQTGCPTGASRLAQTLITLAMRTADPGFGAWGTYHYCGHPITSRSDFARSIFEHSAQIAGLPAARVKDVSSSEFATLARRPSMAAMDCSRIEQTFGTPRHDWRPSLVHALERIADPPDREPPSVRPVSKHPR